MLIAAIQTAWPGLGMRMRVGQPTIDRIAINKLTKRIGR